MFSAGGCTSTRPPVVENVQTSLSAGHPNGEAGSIVETTVALLVVMVTPSRSMNCFTTLARRLMLPPMGKFFPLAFR